VSVFVAVEGIDGAGTTTAAHGLARSLRAHGQPTLLTCEPTDGPIGRMIRAVLSGAERPHRATLPWMFAADRADHLHAEIEPALAAHTAVVTDRYLHSSLAYQSLTLPLDQVLQLNASFRAPHLTLFLRLAPELAWARIESRSAAREIFERKELLTRIAARYDVVMDRLQQRGDPIVVVDASASVEQVGTAVWQATRALLP
jgi:dTMP kinase